MKTTIDAMKRAVEILNGSTLASDVDDAAVEVLREAIAREEAQTVEPVGVVDEGDDGLFVDLETPHGVVVKRGDKLFTHPAPAVKQTLSTEREALIDVSRRCADWLRNTGKLTEQDGEMAKHMNLVADMLAADAQRVERLKCALEKLRGMAPEGLGISLFIKDTLEGL